MKRRVALLFSAMLITGMTMKNSMAITKTKVNYSTSTMQLIHITCNGNSSQIAYGHLFPGVTSPAVKLQFWNASQTVLYASEIYPAYPVNPNHLSYLMAPYQVIRYYVRPAVENQYVWGYGEYWNSL